MIHAVFAALVATLSMPPATQKGMSSSRTHSRSMGRFSAQAISFCSAR
ncbi:hypothetical protein HMPREF9080_00059 [Cardiobacterium valvarum F0432]|uniref:Uncharacterized protein n=1 Tax=Cardiobacterium valvarum F0432 TaxID=797473 RepID=G9ZBD6_9GAMM|nr:hypothetical protein HMPREF9080_00059 [Cardiobacterium valvarum F0432]